MNKFKKIMLQDAHCNIRLFLLEEDVVNNADPELKAHYVEALSRYLEAKMKIKAQEQIEVLQESFGFVYDHDYSDLIAQARREMNKLADLVKQIRGEA